MCLKWRKQKEIDRTLFCLLSSPFGNFLVTLFRVAAVRLIRVLFGSVFKGFSVFEFLLAVRSDPRRWFWLFGFCFWLRRAILSFGLIWPPSFVCLKLALSGPRGGGTYRCLDTETLLSKFGHFMKGGRQIRNFKSSRKRQQLEKKKAFGKGSLRHPCACLLCSGMGLSYKYHRNCLSRNEPALPGSSILYQ